MWPQALGVALLLLASAALGLTGAQQPAAAAGQWTVVDDLSTQRDVALQIVGPSQQPFPRPPPRTVEASLLRDFAESFNLMQDVNADSDTMFTLTADQYVATIPSGFVEGEGGLVYDASGRVYHLPHFFFERTSSPLLRPMPQRTLGQAGAECERHTALASVVQKYGHMYYHFVEEALPRMALLLKAQLPPGTKLLTWGAPYEYEYLELMGIPRYRVVAYDPAKVYCADTLFVPTPTPRITPAREGLLATREALGVQTLPDEERTLLIYVSRDGEPTRRVANEARLLGTLGALLPSEQLVVFNGSLGAAETIKLFQRAKVVMGPHGAGLSHALFSAPGTTVVEFLFLADPPLMFWHSAAALGQQYWLVPVPQSFWMQDSMEVPIDEVADVLGALGLPLDRAPLACPPGSFYIAGKCAACPPGTYAFGQASWTCMPCFHGRVAGATGSAYCTTCPAGTYSDTAARQCLACPAGTFSPLAGAWDAARCLTPQQRQEQMADPTASAQQLAKLSPLFARAIQRRTLVEQALLGAQAQQAQQAVAALAAGSAAVAALNGGGKAASPAAATAPASTRLSQAELCSALAAAGGGGTGWNDPYRGPYLFNATLLNCQPASPVVPSPYGLASPVPPVDVPVATPPPVAVPTLSSPVPTGWVPSWVSESLPEPWQQPSAAGGSGLSVPGTSASPLPEPGHKKMVDKLAVILLSVLGTLIALPAAVLSARYLLRRRCARQQSMAARAAAAAAARGGQASDHVEYLVAFTRPDHMGRVEGHDDLGAALMG